MEIFNLVPYILSNKKKEEKVKFNLHVHLL